MHGRNFSPSNFHEKKNQSFFPQISRNIFLPPENDDTSRSGVGAECNDDLPEKKNFYEASVNIDDFEKGGK